MRRRDVVLGACAAGALLVGPGRPGRGLALAAGRWRIGQMLPGDEAAVGYLASTLEEHLAELGDGDRVTLLDRYAAPDPRDMTAAMRALEPEIDLLVAWGTIGAVAARNAAVRVPVVFLAVGAAVALRLVNSLAHPGGTTTGVTFEESSEAYAKRLQLLKQILPDMTRAAVLGAPGDENAPAAM